LPPARSRWRRTARIYGHTYPAHAAQSQLTQTRSHAPTVQPLCALLLHATLALENTAAPLRRTMTWSWNKARFDGPMNGRRAVSALKLRRVTRTYVDKLFSIKRGTIHKAGMPLRPPRSRRCQCYSNESDARIKVCMTPDKGNKGYIDWRDRGPSLNFKAQYVLTPEQRVHTRGPRTKVCI